MPSKRSERPWTKVPSRAFDFRIAPHGQLSLCVERIRQRPALSCVCVCWGGGEGRGGAAPAPAPAPAATLTPAECNPLLRVCKSRGATRPCNTRWPAPSPGLDTGNAASLPRSSSAAPPEGGFLPPAEPHVSLGLRSNVDGRLFLFSFFFFFFTQKSPEVNLPPPRCRQWAGTLMTQHDSGRPRQAADSSALMGGTGSSVLNANQLRY